MLFEIIQAVNDLLGVDVQPRDLTFANVLLRGLVIFTIGLIAVRIAKTRFTGEGTPFDILMGIMLGAVLSRAINGSAPFWPTVAVGFLLVGLHTLLARLSFHWHPFGAAVKGRATVLVKDGLPDRATMKRRAVTELDLLEALRLNGGVQSVDQVREARLERNGQISVIKR